MRRNAGRTPERLAYRDADAGAGVAEPRSRRKRAGRPVSQSQSATGALQAMQATNQLLALQAKQSIQAQQLQITQDRAASLELARQAAATERAREVRRRFRHRHAVHAAVRQLLQQLTGGGHAMRSRSVGFAAGRAADRLRPVVRPTRADDLAATLAADPLRLKALRARCEADRQAVGEDTCRAAAEAFRRRFFAGQTGPDEYRRWPNCHRSRRASTHPLTTRQKAMRRSRRRRTRHERRDRH